MNFTPLLVKLEPYPPALRDEFLSVIEDEMGCVQAWALAKKGDPSWAVFSTKDSSTVSIASKHGNDWEIARLKRHTAIARMVWRSWIDGGWAVVGSTEDLGLWGRGCR